MSKYAVTGPSTGTVVRSVPVDSDDRVMAAAAASHAAFEDWGRTSAASERARLVGRVGELHVQRRHDLATAIHREMGKAMNEALGEVDFSASIYAYYADNAERFLADEPMQSALRVPNSHSGVSSALDLVGSWVVSGSTSS